MAKVDKHGTIRWVVAGALVLGCSLLAQPKIGAQAIFEYGRQLGSLKRPGGSRIGGGDIGRVKRSEGFDQIPVRSLPSMLSVKGSEVSLYARQNEHSEAVARLDREEKVIPIGQAFGGPEPWYMVKTQQGTIGWIKAADVRELTKGKEDG